MAYGSADFKQYDIIQASDFSRVYDVEPITSGFGDFYGRTQQMTHTVQKGETLGTIAAKYYGTSSKYMDIFNANRAVLTLRGPDYLEAGWKLVIPAVSNPQAAKAEVRLAIDEAKALSIKEESFMEKNKHLLLLGAIAGLVWFLSTRKGGRPA